MVAQYGTFAHGATVFPISTSAANSFLKDADPSVYWCLDFFEFVIEHYIGDRLVSEAMACGAPIDRAVAYALPDNPAAYLTEEQARFPLLAIDRVRDAVQDRTVTWRESKNEWKLYYVLPPLSPGQRERIKPSLRAIARIIDARLESMSDPAYRSGARVFGAGYANLEKIGLVSVDYGEWDAGAGLTFPSVTLTLEVAERDMPVAGAFESLTETFFDQSLDEALPSLPPVSGIQTIVSQTVTTGTGTGTGTGSSLSPATVTAYCLATDNVGDVVSPRDHELGGVMQVTKVDPTDIATMPAIGIILSKESNTQCTVLMQGVVPVGNLVDTPPLANDRLFIGSDGRLTTVRPNGPVFLQVFAVALWGDKLLVRPSFDLSRLI